MSGLLSQEDRQIIIDFANRHFPEGYKERTGRDGLQLVPKYCPLCHGGDHHDEYTFTINVDRGLFVCKRGSCGQRGRFADLAAMMGVPKEGARLSQKQAASPITKTDRSFVLPTTKLRPCTEEIYTYFERRCISRATVDAFKIQSDAHGNIVFPFYQNGVLVFEKFRAPRKPIPGDPHGKEWRAPGTKPILFGMDMCSFSYPLVITEGEIDCMSLVEAGVDNVVSVPSGCEDTAWVELCWDWLERFPNIILFGDNDDPGRRMVANIAKRLGESRCSIVEDYPERPETHNGKPCPGAGTPCKDANEILLFHGGFELVDMVMEAKEIPVKGLLDLASVAPQDPTSVPRIKTSIPKLDEITGGLLEGGITVILGKAGSGKSILANMITLSAIENGNTVCVYTGEFRSDRFQYWINLQAAGSDYITLKQDPVKGKPVPILPYAVQERIMQWYAGKLLLYDNDETFSCDQGDAIIEVFTTAIRKHGAKLLVCDNLMTAVSDKEDEWRAQAIFANKLKQLANKYGVAVLLVTHARKTKSGERLQQSDVSGASATANLADIVITVEPGTLTVVKNRDTGILSTVEFCYCPDSRRIYQADAGDKLALSWDKTGIQMADPKANSIQDYAVVPPSINNPF